MTSGLLRATLTLLTGSVLAVGVLDSIWPTKPPSEMMMGGEAPPNDWAATSRPRLRRSSAAEVVVMGRD